MFIPIVYYFIVVYICCMANIYIETTITLDDGTVVKNSGTVAIHDETKNQKIEIEYCSPSDGGPVMRPNNPPSW